MSPVVAQGASVPPGRVKSATSGPTSSPPCARTPADDVTLVMPSVNAKVMDLFLAHFADTLDQDAGDVPISVEIRGAGIAG